MSAIEEWILLLGVGAAIAWAISIEVRFYRHHNFTELLDEQRVHGNLDILANLKWLRYKLGLPQFVYEYWVKEWRQIPDDSISPPDAHKPRLDDLQMRVEELEQQLRKVARKEVK